MNDWLFERPWILATLAALVMVAAITAASIFSPSCVRGHYETRNDPGGMKYGLGYSGKMEWHYEGPSTSTVHVCDEYGPSAYERWKARRQQ